ncbi:hypothetical protein Plhal304r1_c067g0155291 [Plasmopara halstedii]
MNQVFFVPHVIFVRIPRSRFTRHSDANSSAVEKATSTPSTVNDPPTPLMCKADLKCWGALHQVVRSGAQNARLSP